jgi:hypothetical protein
MPPRRDPVLDPPLASNEPRRTCEWPDCAAAGDHRAPRAPDALRDYRWFCLEHVRAYNQQWDYFAGRSREDIEAHLRADVTWHRPTWRMGPIGGGGRFEHVFRDPFDVFGAGTGRRTGDFGERNGHAGSYTLSGEAARMLAVLDLEPGVSLDILKRRYKELAKRHHPDLHGGDRRAEERLKLINEAYTYLRGSGLFA